MNLLSVITHQANLYAKVEQITDPSLKQQVTRLLRHMNDMSDVAQMRGISAAAILLITVLITVHPNNNQNLSLLDWITSGIMALLVVVTADNLLHTLVWSQMFAKPDKQIRGLLAQDLESYKNALQFIDEADNNFAGSLAAHFLNELKQ